MKQRRGGGLLFCGYSSRKTWEKNVRRFIIGMCAGIIGISSLAAVPAQAQEAELLPETGAVQFEEDVATDGQGSSGSSENEDLLMVGLSSTAVIGAALAGGAWAVQQGMIPNPLPGILPSPAPAPAPSPVPTPAPAPQRTPVLYNCYMTEPEVRPQAIILFCGDAHSILDEITWHSWSVEGASGRALLKARTCVPDCATGGYTARWVDFTLGGIKWNGNEPEFTLAMAEGTVYRIGEKPSRR